MHAAKKFNLVEFGFNINIMALQGFCTVKRDIHIKHKYYEFELLEKLVEYQCLIQQDVRV